jgi:hypothetical protein
MVFKLLKPELIRAQPERLPTKTLRFPFTKGAAHVPRAVFELPFVRSRKAATPTPTLLGPVVMAFRELYPRPKLEQVDPPTRE